MNPTDCQPPGSCARNSQEGDIIRWKDPALVVVIIATIAALFAITLIEEGAYNRGPFDISYELDGGINDERNPTSYIRGDSIEILPASKEGMVFDGWYRDIELHHRFAGIDAGTAGNITLYAGWADDRSGTGTRFSINGYSEDGTRTWKYNGTVEISWMYHSPYRLAYYMQIDHSVDVTEYMFGDVVDSFNVTGSSSAWGSDLVSPRTYIGSETIRTAAGEKACSVYSCVTADRTALRLWICDDDSTVYRIQADSDSNHFTMEFEEKTEVPVVEHVSVTVRGDRGIIAYGDGVDAPGMILTLTAEGEAFSGWYDSEGNLVSTSPIFEYEVEAFDAEFLARGNAGPVMASAGTGCALDTGFELLDAVWNIFNGSEPIGTLEGSTPSFTFDSPGTYKADAKGRTADGTEHLWRIAVVCGGDVAREFAWTYDDTEYAVSVSIDYLRYLELHGRSQDIRGTVGEESIAFADPSDPVIASLASKLGSMASEIGLDPVETANFILAFVQSMGSDGTGLWKYPVEVLFETSGNDKSCSALYASLMSSLGHRSSLLLFPGHTAAGVEIEGSKGVFYSYYGIKYRYCECSPSSDERVGEKPEGIANRVSRILELRCRG